MMVWGSADTKEYIESSKCRLAILDYCKRNQLTTGKFWLAALHVAEKCKSLIMFYSPFE